MILELIQSKHHEGTLEENTFFKKGLFAIIELGECLDIIKKKGIKYLQRNPDVAEEVAEEYIDSLFYILDSYGVFYRNKVFKKSADEMFEYKWNKNMGRPVGYGRPNPPESIIKEEIEGNTVKRLRSAINLEEG